MGDAYQELKCCISDENVKLSKEVIDKFYYFTNAGKIEKEEKGKTKRCER